MQENIFTRIWRLLSIIVRLGLPLAVLLLTVLMPVNLVSGSSSTLDPVDQPISSKAAPEVGWNALSNYGLDLRVRDLALVGDSLYTGGRFTESADGMLKSLGRVARFDITDRSWHPLPNQGLNNEVTQLAVVDGDLYAGGWFTQTADAAVTDLGYLAHYDPDAGIWQALSNQGLDEMIFGLGPIGSDLYAGGKFTQSGDGTVANLNGVARYDTLSGSWHALPKQGLDGYIYALTTDGNDVYAGGSFYRTGDGSLTNLGNIAHYDSLSGTWHPLSNQGLNGTVNGLFVFGNDLYVGGNFSQTGDGTVSNLNHIARYDSQSGTWHALSNQGLNGGARAFVMWGEDLYVGGTFDQTFDGSLNSLGYIARYNTVSETWHALPNQGLNNWVYAFHLVGSDLYMGGEFNLTGDGIINGLGHIARFGNADPKVYLPLVVRK